MQELDVNGENTTFLPQTTEFCEISVVVPSNCEDQSVNGGILLN
jgi:hypothetical protein